MIKEIINDTIGKALNPRESSWFSAVLSSLPLSFEWKEIMNRLTKGGKGAFIFIEKPALGGNTYETGCCVTQGNSVGLHNIIPLPTHRAMFIGQPEKDSDKVTCTFRYVSDIGLKDLTSGENNPIDVAWIPDLPCFPRALAIQEIDGNLGDAVCNKYAKDRGIYDVDSDKEWFNKNSNIPFPDSKKWDKWMTVENGFAGAKTFPYVMGVTASNPKEWILKFKSL